MVVLVEIICKRNSEAGNALLKLDDILIMNFVDMKNEDRNNVSCA